MTNFDSDTTVHLNLFTSDLTVQKYVVNPRLEAVDTFV